MKNKFLELVFWELRDNWSFPILEIVVAITVVQAMSFTAWIWDNFFGNILFVLVLSAAIVFGKSFGESIEKRKLIVLLSFPVSRTRLFLVKYLTNFLMLFLICGLGLLAQGISLLLFEDFLSSVSWGFAFLYLLLDVFFLSSLMTFFALITKRFGLSILIFLIFMFGMRYWIPININDPLSYLLLDLSSSKSVEYLTKRYEKWLGALTNIPIPDVCFLTGLAYLLGVGLVLFLASLIVMKKMDLD